MLSQSINTTHASMIHDLAYDYYGDKLATCASDGYVHVYDVSKQQSLIATIKVRDSPLWSLAWAHPRFGNVIAVSSFDGEVTIYKEQKEWIKVASHSHQSSVNCICWFPKESILTCAASDGKFQIYEIGSLFILDNLNSWHLSTQLIAHDAPIHGLAWSKDGELLATASSDKSVKLWQLRDGEQFEFVLQMNSHTELVRDVQWHPLEQYLLASGGEDGKLILSRVKFGKNEIPSQIIEQTIDLHVPIWKVDFNNVGNRIAVSLEQNGQTKTVILEQINSKYQLSQEII